MNKGAAVIILFLTFFLCGSGLDTYERKIDRDIRNLSHSSRQKETTITGSYAETYNIVLSALHDLDIEIIRKNYQKGYIYGISSYEDSCLVTLKELQGNRVLVTVKTQLVVGRQLEPKTLLDLWVTKIEQEAEMNKSSVR